MPPARGRKGLMNDWPQSTSKSFLGVPCSAYTMLVPLMLELKWAWNHPPVPEKHYILRPFHQFLAILGLGRGRCKQKMEIKNGLQVEAHGRGAENCSKVTLYLDFIGGFQAQNTAWLPIYSGIWAWRLFTWRLHQKCHCLLTGHLSARNRNKVCRTS